MISAKTIIFKHKDPYLSVKPVKQDKACLFVYYIILATRQFIVLYVKKTPIKHQTKNIKVA